MNVAMLTSIIIIIVIVTNKNSIDAFLPPGSVLFCFFGHILQFFSLTYLLTYWSEYKKYSYSKKRKELKYWNKTLPNNNIFTLRKTNVVLYSDIDAMA